MTDFDDVRIRATRLGAGTAKNVQRIRRHITKGFYDPVPEGGGDPGDGSTFITEVTNWSVSGDGWFNVYVKTINSNESENIVGPNWVGQVLVLNLSVISGGAYTWTVNSSLLSEDTSDHTSVALDAEGENILLIGLYRETELRWFVWANNGGVLA